MIVILFLLLLSSCTVYTASYQDTLSTVEDPAQHRELPVPPGWQGKYMPIVANQGISSVSLNSISELYLDYNSDDLHFPYLLTGQIIALGNYKGSFSSWRMIIQDETGNLPVYIYGGMDIDADDLGEEVAFEVWGLESKNGQLQISTISNLSLAARSYTGFIADPWDRVTTQNGDIVYWTAPVTSIEHGSICTLRSDSFPDIRLSAEALSNTFLEQGDRITVLAAVTYYYNTPQVDLVNYMPGSIWDYIYVH